MINLEIYGGRKKKFKIFRLSMLIPMDFIRVKEFLQIDWTVLLGYFPLGVIGFWRWIVWSFKKIISFFYQNPEGNFKSTFSIITPVYNEDPAMFKLALLSWKENKPDEIIAVIDYTDKKCIKIFKKFSQNFSGAKLIITQKPGKRAALVDGIKISTGELVALVDSDTIWTKNLKEKVSGPFENKRVGGVAPRQDVMETDSLAKKLFQIHIFNRYGNDLIFQAAFGNALSCISGRTGVYRRSAIFHLTDALENEFFLGKKCISGDDKRLTYLIQKEGWEVKYLEKALVYTQGFSDLKTYTKQQIRWTRNSWRSDLKSIFSFWLWKNPFLAFHTIDRFFQPFSLILGPIFLFIAFYKGDWLVAGILIIWWLISRAIKIFGHLKKHPKDILILPIYIFYCYVIAVIKIYTLLTVDEQSWITRWSKDRVNVANLLEKFSAYAATLAIVFLLFFVSFEINVRLVAARALHQKVQLEKIKKEASFFRTEKGSDFIFLENDNFAKNEKELYEKIMSDNFAYYQVKAKETIGEIKKRYLLSPEIKIFDEDKKELAENVFVRSGDRLLISVDDLRKSAWDFYQKNSLIKPIIVEDLEEKAVRIKGKGSFITIPELAKLINNKNILESLGEKEWILRKNLFIDDGVTLIIDGKDVSWLKLKSTTENFAWLKAENGNILINKTKITSWDEIKNDFDQNIEDGRSYILQKSDGRMDIKESELAYLGYAGFPKRGNPFGGPYGISLKIQNNTFQNELSTGSIVDSKIHHNFFGVYTFGVTGAVFINNDVFENLEYGIDPHDDSNNLLIEGNRVYKNGNHGIIASKRCFKNIIRGNFSQNNKLHGIMLDKNSNNNLVENNFSSDNVNGMAINSSSENLIINNNFFENKFGIRANNFSNNNFLGYNKITESEKGIFIYQNSNRNYIFRNDFVDNKTKIQFRQGSENFFNKQ